VRTYERHQLKQDSFAARTGETLSWAVQHRNKLTAGIVIAVVVLVAVIAGFWISNHRNEEANLQLGKAMQTYSALVLPPNVPPEPGMVSFTSAAEKSRAAHAEFQKIADQYGWTRAGKIARYMAALTAQDLGDTKAAEEGLQSIAGSGDADLSSLAKLALAGLYRDTHRTEQAQQLYKELIDRPTNAVTKATAQLRLAALYESNNQASEAAKLYSEVMKDDPRSAAASLANQQLSKAK
jgi:predicted negative regulator of RcsB-dependent stress response